MNLALNFARLSYFSVAIGMYTMLTMGGASLGYNKKRLVKFDIATICLLLAILFLGLSVIAFALK